MGSELTWTKEFFIELGGLSSDGLEIKSVVFGFGILEKRLVRVVQM